MGQLDIERRTVWIVDDSAMDAERARRALGAEYEIRIFQDGAAVLEHIAGNPPPDVLVLDWIMPGISGIDVCSFLRSESTGHPEVGILLLTVRNQTEQVVEGLLAGANDYIAKPYSDAELRARVGALVRTKRLIDRAERAEASVRNLLANAPDPLLAIDAEGRLIYVNAAATAMLDTDAGQILGRLLTDVIPDFPLRNITVGPAEPLVPLADITVHGQLYAPTVRVLASDTAAHTTIALRNMTHTRQAEARRLDFYSIIAHDLRSPLNAVMLRTSLILNGRYGILPTELLDNVRKIDRDLRSQVALITDFLELARLEGAGYKIARDEVDVISVLDQTVEESRPLIEASRLTLTSELPDAEAKVLGDRRRLAQVVSNLLANAIKFTPPGGAVKTRVAVTDRYVETTVEDTGPGIPADVLPTIFDRFTRGQATSHVVGTGLGLMIVRELVEAHGGTVGVDSTLGQGSKFWFRLPRQPRPSRAPDAVV
jgi:signal transduction histidine kinase